MLRSSTVKQWADRQGYLPSEERRSIITNMIRAEIATHNTMPPGSAHTGESTELIVVGIERRQR
jgi:hypothetical protein